MDDAVLQLMFLCAFAGFSIGSGVIMLGVEYIEEKTVSSHGVISVLVGLIVAVAAVCFASSNF